MCISRASLVNNKYTWFFGHRDKASMFSVLGGLTKVGASNQIAYEYIIFRSWRRPNKI